MKEDFLHYIWKFAKFNHLGLQTTEGVEINIIKLGVHNQYESGPDFFNAQLQIGKQRWAGNVEIHLKSSDWYAHGHHHDKAYQNVILHVVWEHDMDVFRADETKIPTLTLKERIQDSATKNYQHLLENSLRWINCEADFASFEEIKLKTWLERVFVERLEEKSNSIQQLLEGSKNDWNAVLFQILAKNFGLKLNGESFMSIANSIPFHVFQKCSHSQFQLEALLFGQAHLLGSTNNETAYFQSLVKEYAYICQKFQIKNKSTLPVKFYGARPNNFPTIRLAQLASLFHTHQHLFSEVIKAKTRQEIIDLFQIEVSEFWLNHYTFDKQSKPRKKQLTKNFIDLLIINTVVPLQFSFAKFTQNIEVENASLNLISSLPIEKNNIINKFLVTRKNAANNALESQALLYLKKNYCDFNKCLQCNLGIELLGR